MSHIKVKIKYKRGFGHSKSKSERKVKRAFHLNKQKFTFVSRALSSKIVLRCTCRDLRSIMNHGGDIDNYIMNAKNIQGKLLALRHAIKKKGLLSSA